MRSGPTGELPPGLEPGGVVFGFPLSSWLGQMGGAGVAEGVVVGMGMGWTRIADAVVQRVPVNEVERIWVFRPVRMEDREWGTAVIARRASAGRLKVYTGSYILFVRGREKGQGRVEVEEVGEGPDDVLDDVLRGVQERAGEAEPPGEVPVTAWYEPVEETAVDDASATAD